MFIGHFALGFAAKKATPRTSLATLFVAAQFADILWPIFLALGIEQVLIVPGKTAANPLDFVSYPFSHSLLLEQAIELVMYVAGVWIYSTSTRAKDKQGVWGFWILTLLLLASFFASSYSGAPPSVKAIWITAMIGTLITLLLALWTDRHRRTVPQ